MYEKIHMRAPLSNAQEASVYSGPGSSFSRSLSGFRAKCPIINTISKMLTMIQDSSLIAYSEIQPMLVASAAESVLCPCRNEVF